MVAEAVLYCVRSESDGATIRESRRAAGLT